METAKLRWHGMEVIGAHPQHLEFFPLSGSLPVHLAPPEEGAYMYFDLKDFGGRGGSIKEAYYLGQCEHGVWQKSLTASSCPIAGGLVRWRTYLLLWSYMRGFTGRSHLGEQ